MPDAISVAKYLLKQGLDTDKNCFDGNMKLQKLLVLANLVSLAERDVPLFDDKILAFEQGCVIEDIRLRYKNDFNSLIADSHSFNPTFTKEEYDILNLTIALFGKLSARELSKINHTFSFWRTALENSTNSSGYRDKSKAIVTVDAMREELKRVKTTIAAYRDTLSDNQAVETINGINFYYTPNDPELTEDILDELYRFSLVADENAYSVYIDNGSLVIC